MNIRRAFKSMLTLATIALLVGLTGCYLIEPENAAEFPTAAAPPSQVSPLQTPPAPITTSSTAPTPIRLQPGQTFQMPTWTPFPTFPPPPTPTRRPGPTATALPLSQPAKDASGSLTYAVRDKAKKASVYSLSMDKDGRPQASPAQLPNDEAGWGLVYPAPDGSRLAIAGDWGVGVIFYTDSGRTEPLFRKGLNPQGLFFGWHPDSRHVLIRARQSYADVGLWLVDVDSGEHVTLLNQSPSPTVNGGAVSPDGQKVIYALQKDFDSPGELWTINADGSNPRLLFTSPGWAIYALAWSPNSSQIAFVGDGIMVMNVDGSPPRTVTKNSIAPNYLFSPMWSPDSRMLAFVTLDGPSPFTQKGAPQGDWDVDVFKGANVHLVDVATGKERHLLNDGSTGNIDPAWSPDGSQIAFASTRSGTNEIWAVNVDGSNPRQLTHVGTDQVVRYPYWRRSQKSSQP